MRYFLRHDGRTYSIFPARRDLLGDLILVTIHGSTQSRLGGVKTYVAKDSTDAERMEAGIAATRIKHGYVELR